MGHASLAVNARAQDVEDGFGGDDPAPMGAGVQSGETLDPWADPEAGLDPEPPALPQTLCDGMDIRNLHVTGTHRVSEQDVRATLTLKAGDLCTDARVTRDAKALWQLGFFDDIAVAATPVGEGAIDLIVEVVERPALASVVFEGVKRVNQDKIDEVIQLEEGEVLLLRDVKAHLQRIREVYTGEGFFLARVRYELEDAENESVTVKFIIDEGAKVVVRNLRFIGNREVPESTLRKFLQTRETSFLSFMGKRNRYDASILDEDLQRLQAIYYDRGFLKVSVGTPYVEVSADRRYIDVTLTVNEGPRYRVGRMRIQELDERGEDITPLGGRPHLQSLLPALSGEWFSRTKIAEGLQDITRFYRDQGFAQVEVLPETQLDDNRRIVHLTLQIRRGPLMRIERIFIRGNSKTRDAVVRREMRISEGDLYNMTAIERSRGRIQALGYFEQVEMSEERGSRPDSLVLQVEVSERSTGTFQVGAGFSSLENFIFTAQVQQQNFMGRGQSLSLQLQLSAIRQLAQLRFVEPYLMGTEWSAAFDAYKTIRQLRDFTRDSTGGGVTFGHPVLSQTTIGDSLRFFLRYRAEYVLISQGTGNFFGGNSGGRGFGIFQRLPLSNLFRDGWTSSVQFTLSYDTRNDRMFPTRGFYTSASTEVAESALGSDNVFTRQRVFARAYREIWKGIVLKLNTEWGMITSRQDAGVPIYERYFLGGIFNVRGYFLNTLGPRAGLPSDTDPNAVPGTNGVVIGGNMQAFYNLELEFPIIKEINLRGVLFTDGGNTWNTEDALCGSPLPANGDASTDPCGIHLNQIRTSVGFGVRWISPMGPLRFEWGIPINRRDYERPTVFEFNIGNFF